MKAHKLWRSSALLAGLIVAGAVAACTGSINDPNGVSGSNGTPPGSTTGGGGSGSPGTGGTTSPPGAVGSVLGPSVAESAGQLVMRRLSYREYDHNVAVLLGDTSLPASGADGWSPDAPAETGFVSPNSVASYHVVEYNQTASALVDKAVAALTAGQKTTGKFVLPAGCSVTPTAAQETSCATNFITAFGLQAFRRPVATDEQASYLALFSTVRTTDKFSFVDSIGAIAKAMLQSPNFIYHWEIGPTKPTVGSDGLVALTPWQIASRLAMGLWEGMPDDTLLTAARNGQLSTADQVIGQAERMLADNQANQSLYSFHLQWLFNMGFHVTDLSTIVGKDNSPLTDAAAQGLQSEFTLFLNSVYAPPGDGTLKSLYTAPYAFVNKDLAAIYGVPAPATDFAKVALDPAQRAGIFTQVAFLAGIEDSVADNPIYRGLAIYTKALCGKIGSPPMNVPTVNFTSGGTTRQAYDAHGSSACASGCHTLFDPPGFAFENYDGAGKYRTMDGTQPVDATGTFSGPLKNQGVAGGSTFTFNNAVELVTQLADSEEARACVSRQWSRYMLGRLEASPDMGSLQAAYHSGASIDGFSLRDMLTALLSSKAFMQRTPSDGEPM